MKLVIKKCLFSDQYKIVIDNETNSSIVEFINDRECVIASGFSSKNDAETALTSMQNALMLCSNDPTTHQEILKGWKKLSVDFR